MQDKFDRILIGDTAEICHIITASDVDDFVQLTGDDNPLHTDEKFAKTTDYKKRVVHGMLTASFISTIIGTKLPGKGALWYQQQLTFLNPVRIGEEIKVIGKVIGKSESQRTITVETIITNSQGKTVVEGEAKVKVAVIKENKIVEKQEVKKGAVIITGASRGIGAAMAVQLATEGYPVVINYNKDRDSANEIRHEILENNGEAIVVKADVTDPQEVDQMVRRAHSEFGFLQGAISSAAPNINHKSFLESDWEQYQSHIDVQIKGYYYLVKSILPILLEQKSGSVISIGSLIIDDIPPLKMGHYCTSKSGLWALTKSLAAEFGPKNIRFNMVSPSMTETDLITDVPEKTKMITKMQTPLRKIALPEDIAGVAAFLFSEKANFITGQNIRVNGGNSML